MNEVVAVSEPTRIVTALYLNHERKFVEIREEDGEFGREFNPVETRNKHG